MTQESPETEMLDDNDPTGVAQALELQLGSDDPDWERVEEAGRYFTALARRRRQAQRGGSDD